MTVVSSKEFVINEDKYFDLALDEQVTIKRGRNMFRLMYAPPETYPEQPVLEPDEELRNAITVDELLERTYERIHKFFVNKNELSISNDKGA